MRAYKLYLNIPIEELPDLVEGFEAGGFGKNRRDEILLVGVVCGWGEGGLGLGGGGVSAG